MKDRMHITFRLSEAIQHGTDRIGNSSADEIYHSTKAKQFHRRFDKQNNTPSHAKITDHRHFLIFFKVNCGKCRRTKTARPHHTKDHKCDDRMIDTDSCQRDRSISTCDQKIDRAVVNDLKHFFCPFGCQPMINT